MTLCDGSRRERLVKAFRFAHHLETGWGSLPDAAMDTDQSLIVVFGASRIDVTAPIQALRARFPRSTIVGCSTAGEIHQTRVHDESIAALMIQLERSRLRTATAPLDGSGSSYEAGASISRQLAAPDLRAVLVLSDGLDVDGSGLAAGLHASIGADVVVTGGLAADGERFEKTWVLNDDRPVDGLVTAVGLYGADLRVGHGSKGGWDIFGPERVVSRSEGNVLYELDGRPALALYKEYLGNRAAGLPTTALLFPLAIFRESGERVVRTVLAVDESTQSMRFAGDVPQGAISQLMRANFDRLVMGAADAAQSAVVAGATGDVVSLAVSCVGRRLVLKGRIEEETEAVLDVLPPDTRQIGFYSYGEISPGGRGNCELHNQTMTLTTLHEVIPG